MALNADEQRIIESVLCNPLVKYDTLAKCILSC